MGVFSNNLLAGAAAAASAGGAGFYDYQIEQSVRFDRASESGLQWGGAGSYTLGTPTNADKYTWSAWIKRATLGNVYMNILHGHTGSNGINTAFDDSGTDDTLGVNTAPGVAGGDSTMLFRDTGWYHIVLAWDTTDGTNANRLKVYVNGNEISGFDNTISQNQDVAYNVSGNRHYIGRNKANGYGFDGYMAEINSIDGQQLTPTSFGEFKNGVWKPIDTADLTFGNNGYRLKFENASDLGNDSSGNNNDFGTYGMGADHQVLDSPTFGS
jgi:hypothetical protein